MPAQGAPPSDRRRAPVPVRKAWTVTSSPTRTSSATEDAAWTPGVSAESAAAVDDPTATPLGFGVGAAYA